LAKIQSKQLKLTMEGINIVEETKRKVIPVEMIKIYAIVIRL